MCCWLVLGHLQPYLHSMQGVAPLRFGDCIKVVVIVVIAIIPVTITVILSVVRISIITVIYVQ